MNNLHPIFQAALAPYTHGLQERTDYFLSKQLRALLKSEVVNDHALLEMLQQVQWKFPASTTAGDALTTCVLAIDDELNTTSNPTAEDLAELADFRRREIRDREAEKHFEGAPV